MTQNKPVFEVTTDPTRIDLDRVDDWIARKSYWAGQMPRRLFDRAVRGSLCFAAVEAGATVGFCRVISDRATFAYVSDMFVDPGHRGKGIGKAIMAAIMAHPDLQEFGVGCSSRVTRMGFMQVSALRRSPRPSGSWRGAIQKFTSAWPTANRSAGMQYRPNLRVQ